jgi:hypothetical protein
MHGLYPVVHCCTGATVRGGAATVVVVSGTVVVGARVVDVVEVDVVVDGAEVANGSSAVVVLGTTDATFVGSPASVAAPLTADTQTTPATTATAHHRPC